MMIIMMVVICYSVGDNDGQYSRTKAGRELPFLDPQHGGRTLR